MPPAGSSGPQLTARAKHRRAPGTVEVRVEAASAGTWNLTVDLAVTGRGLTKPVVAVLGLFRRVAAREFDKLVAETSQSIGKLNRELNSRLGRGQDADQMAGALLGELLDAVAERVPTPGPNNRRR